MKTNVTDQTKLDNTEHISSLEKEMHLSAEHVLKLFQDKVTAERKVSFRRKMSYAAMAACVMLVIAVNWNSIYTFASELLAKSTVMVKDNVLTDNEVTPITIKEPDTLDEYGQFRGSKYYSSLKECAEALGIDILSSDLSWNESFDKKVFMEYPTDGSNEVVIHDFSYIIGDLKNFSHKDTSFTYESPTSQDKYASPVSLRLEFFITGTKEQLRGHEEEYLTSELLETYTDSAGREVKILKNNIHEYIAYFYSDNIKYTLTGNVQLSEFKRIIDSFE